MQTEANGNVARAYTVSVGEIASETSYEGKSEEFVKYRKQENMGL